MADDLPALDVAPADPVSERPAPPAGGGGSESGPGRAAAAWLAAPTHQRVATTLAALIAAYAVMQYFWPAPIGVLLQGVVIGGLTALISFGIALVYRANRIVNFAQGDLGALPASLTVLLIVGPGVPYFLALPIGLAAAIALGAFVEFVLIRRFFKAPRLTLTVVTIGVSLVLAGVATLLPRAFSINTPPQSFPSPFEFTFSIGSTVFHGNDVIAMLAVPVLIVALLAFFRYTNIGIAVRASAESADRAALLGVPVKRIETVVWVVATVMSTIAVFLRAGIVGLPFGQLLGPAILLRALTAAVLGKMERFGIILGGAVALGVLESAVVFSTGRAVLVDPILFVIIIGALILQKRGKVARADDQSTWQSVSEFRGVPRELAGLPEVKWVMKAGVWLPLGLAILLPLALSESQVNLAAVIAILSIVGVSLVVLTGWAGQVSLGQIAFLGIGAAVGGWITQSLHWDISVALIGGGLAGAGAALIIGLPALRIQGLFLSVTTLAFALATASYLLNPEFIHWLPTDRFERPFLFGRIALDSEIRYYYFSLAVLAACVLSVTKLRRSRTGRVLIGIRDNERAAQAYGVAAVPAKLTAFAVSGFYAALAGALFVHHQQGLGIEAYSVGRSFQIFIETIIGGLGSVTGGILGVVVIEGLNYFRNLFPVTIRPIIGFITGGVGVIFVLLVLRGGLSAGVYAVRDRYLRAVAERRGILVPSLLADARQADRTTGDDPAAADRAEELVEVLVEEAEPTVYPPALDLTGAEPVLVGTGAPPQRTGSSRRRRATTNGAAR